MSKKVFIYALQYNPTGKLYIGSSTNLETRYKQHITSLRRGTHFCNDLQADFNKFGEDFSFYILEEVKNPYEEIQCGYKTYNKRIYTEYTWMKKYKTITNGYNRQDRSAQKFLNSEEYAFPLKEGLPPLPQEE